MKHFHLQSGSLRVSGAVDPGGPETASAAILDITPFSDTVMKLTVASDNPSILLSEDGLDSHHKYGLEQRGAFHEWARTVCCDESGPFGSLWF